MAGSYLLLAPLTMDLTSIPILSIITFLPLVGAIAVAIAPASVARPLALGFALLTWIVSLVLLVGYLPGRPGFQFVERLRLDPVLRHPVQASAPTGCRSRWSS